MGIKNKILQALGRDAPYVEVLPVPVLANRAPESSDLLPAGALFIDTSVTPNTVYVSLGNGTFESGGNSPATTTEYGLVKLTDNSEPVATKAYADALAIDGAPAWSETVSGIGKLSTAAQAAAGTNDDTAMTPLKVADALIAGLPITGDAGSFTTLAASGLASLSGSATITTGATALNLASDASTGAVNIGTGAGARTITVGNVTGATAVNVNSGTGACAWTTTNGAFSLITGTGTISIGADAADHTINIGNSTGVTAVSLNAGTGGVNVGTNAIAHTVTIGNITGATAITHNSGTGANLWTTTNASWGLSTGTGAINVGTDAAAKTITIGNVTGATAINHNSGTGANLWTTTNGSWGLSTGTGAINIGTDAAAKTITIGNITGATAITHNSGTGANLWTTTNATWGLVTGTGAISISTDAAATTLSIGSGAAAKTVTVGSTTTTSTTTINAGTGSITLASGQVHKVTSVATAASPYTVLGSDYFISTDSTGGVMTLTLPAAPSTGRCIVVYDGVGQAGGNAVTIDGNGKNIAASGTSAATKTVATAYGSKILTYNGTLWLGQTIA